ncbi:efflux RND transporter periplasmic adaptor subunit [Sphingomonas sp.]|uniref:efflux RND transporter periplasmic adaptor subunit n=1 Tax=Sphingomonas sp. TaxID=28214 RepID=UPI001B05FB93|nr:efflux RND transporter periplasmic adaptor subunit [Sphingomonas sp.]MBO9712958.1 efflux RND transporter periplasmic adaptor subunit [Sphingomonas sp.]
MNMIAPIDTAETKPAQTEAEANRSRLVRRAAWIVGPVALVAAGYGLFHRDAPVLAAPPPPTVTVAAPLAQDVTEWDTYVGRFEPSRSVEVRPRVSGAVVAIHFRDGEMVRQGQALFTIDPRPYTAALAEARAGVATAVSDLALARTDYERALKLVSADAVSQSEVDRLRARVQAAQASLAAAQARVRARALDVEFTVVRAPISGRISDRRVDAGNLVAAGEGQASTLLTTINALDPIYFTFDGSEALYLKSKRAGSETAAPVEIKLQDEGDYRWKGHLDFTDNGLDQKSGTIRARAVIANPDNFLAPGLFGNMRLAGGGTTRALLVPDTAISTDQVRKIVLTVGKDGTVAPREVTLGPVVNGLRVIRSGLTPADRVVITGIQFAQPGGKVLTVNGRIAPQQTGGTSDTVAPPPAGEATLAH